MTDPVAYKVLAVLQILVWGSFFVRYLSRLLRTRMLGKESAFAWTLLLLSTAMVVYGFATVARQFLGDDYTGRDAVRSIAASGLILAGLAFHWFITRWPAGNDR